MQEKLRPPSQVNIRAPLLSACLNALTGILEGADALLLKKITFGLGGVVPLMQFIAGRKYEQLAELCGEVDETGVVPLRLLRNKEMRAAIVSVIALIKVYCVRANAGDSDAMDCCNKLDMAGREQVLCAAPERYGRTRLYCTRCALCCHCAPYRHGRA